ncbi:patatin-like phospholipase family protein [candidate division WOR-3 bacterium]|nr:patatin-like phospholipase family protein [candidate division WOR-3 bacterium]
MLRVGTALLLLAGLALGQPAGPSRAEPTRVGLALSGGAALGLAHIGVLKVLVEEGIVPVAVSGNSMGAMVGGVYAAGYSPAEIESIAVNADWGTLFSSGVPFGARYLPERQQAQRYILQLGHRNLFPSLPGGLVPLQNVEFLLMDLLSETEYNTGFDFDRLPTPYRAVAVDLVTGRLQVMRRGRLSQAIRASIAIPGVFAPELLDSMELVDGGVQQYLPVEPLLEFEPDFIIAVLTMKHTPEAGISLIDVASRSMDIVGVEDLARQRALADIVIEPDVDPFSHSDFARAAELVRAGEEAARAALPGIAARLAGQRPVRERNPVETRPLAMVRSVRLEGLSVTRKSTLRPLLQTRAGGYLVFRRLREDLVRLFHTGLFEDVNYRLEFGPAESVDVVVELQERAYGFYSLGIRYDNVDNVGLGLEVGQGNLGGSGAGIRAALHVGDPTEFRFGLTGTRLFMLPFGYRVDGFWGKVDRQYYERGRVQADYGIDYRGGIAEAGYVLGRNAFFKFGLTAYRAGYLVPDRAPPALEALPGSELVAGPLFQLEYDNRVSPWLPSAGSHVVLDALYSTGLFGERGEMARVELRSGRTVGLGRRLFLSGGWELGFTLGDSLFAEYFRAGAEDLPGFGRDEFVSPYKALVQGSFDVRVVDLFGQDEYPLFLGAFATVATFVRPDVLVQRADPLTDLNWSAGLTLRTDTPVGPVVCRLGVADFAKPESFSYAAPRLSLFISVGRDFRYTR